MSLIGFKVWDLPDWLVGLIFSGFIIKILGLVYIVVKYLFHEAPIINKLTEIINQKSNNKDKK